VAVIFTEALHRMGRDITRGKLIQTMEGINNFETGMWSPISFSPTNHQGANWSYLAMVEGGKFIKISDYSRPK